MTELIERYPQLGGCIEDIEEACGAIEETFRSGGKLLICGNGGSAADCEHISGELMKGFLLKRALSDESRAEMSAECADAVPLLDKLQYGLPVIPLPSLTSLTSAVANDNDAEMTYAQAVMALGTAGDALLCISTSGGAAGVCNAALTAAAKKMKTIALTGASGGRLAGICDASIRVPETETYKVQELHLPVYHAICAEIEKRFFGNI